MADETPVDDLEGRELDAAVAEEVFDANLTWREEGGADHPYADRTLWTKWCPTCGYDGHWYARAVPHYSTDIAAAWEVVEALPWKVVVESDDSGAYVAVRAEYGFADTAPKAICRAALKVVRAAEQPPSEG